MHELIDQVTFMRSPSLDSAVRDFDKIEELIEKMPSKADIESLAETERKAGVIEKQLDQMLETKFVTPVVAELVVQKLASEKAASEDKPNPPL